MVAHTAPVTSWGFEPCERILLSTTNGLRGVGRAPRPPGAGRGKPEVQTLLNRAPQAYGGRQFADWPNGAPNEQGPSPAAASFLFPVLASRFQDDRRNRSGGKSRLEVLFDARVDDDLGISEP